VPEKKEKPVHSEKLCRRLTDLPLAQLTAFADVSRLAGGFLTIVCRFIGMYAASDRRSWCREHQAYDK
jgi:hypothetical protein